MLFLLLYMTKCVCVCINIHSMMIKKRERTMIIAMVENPPEKSLAHRNEHASIGGSVRMSSSYTNISATKGSHTDFCVGCSLAFLLCAPSPQSFFACGRVCVYVYHLLQHSDFHQKYLFNKFYAHTQILNRHGC